MYLGKEPINVKELADNFTSKSVGWRFRVGPDLVFLTGCQISGRIIRHVLPDIAGYPAIYCRIAGYPAQP